MRDPFLRKSFLAFARGRERLDLSVAATLTLVAGLLALGSTTVAFGGVTEDVTRHNGLATTDSVHLHWFIQHRSPTLDSIARWLTALGGPPVLVVVVVVSAFVLWWRGQRLLLAIAPGVALGVAGACAAAGKLIVGRSRPPVALHLISETDASFPSGHATDATAVYLTIAFVVAIFVVRRPLARCLCVLGSGVLAAAIGSSRLVLGVHWPTDVVGGWTLGASVAITITIAAGLATRMAPNPPALDRKPLTHVAHVLTRERRSRPLQAA